MTEKKGTARMKNFILTAAVLLGLTLIVGATRNLPASAQGVVTGQNEILIDQLVDRVGDRALAAAIRDAGLPELEISGAEEPETRQRSDRRNRRRDRQAQETPSERNGRGDRQNNQIFGNLDDQLERLGPEIVYQIAVDGALITQAEADAMLAQ